jgi:hypothetical protein
MLRLGLPERTRRRHLGHDLAGPQARRLDVRDRVLGDAALLLVDGEDRRAVAHADVVPLPVRRRRVVDLKEELEQVAVRGLLGIEEDLDRLGVRAVVAVRRVLDVAARVADPRREHAGPLPDQVLHPPEAPAGQDRLLDRAAHRRPPPLVEATRGHSSPATGRAALAQGGVAASGP